MADYGLEGGVKDVPARQPQDQTHMLDSNAAPPKGGHFCAAIEMMTGEKFGASQRLENGVDFEFSQFF